MTDAVTVRPPIFDPEWIETDDGEGYTQASVLRSFVVRAAKGAIATTRSKGVEVPTRLVRRLMHVARTEPKFLVGMWINPVCGCLVGNAFLRGQIPDVEKPTSKLGEATAALNRLLREDVAIDHIGLAFDYLIQSEVETALGEDELFVQVLVVVEDEDDDRA